jgi:hypothetical protein
VIDVLLWIHNYYRWPVEVPDGVRSCPGFVFTYNFNMPIMYDNRNILPTDKYWMPSDIININQSLLLIGELMACSLAYGSDNVDKLFINRLYNCLIIYHHRIIVDNLCKKVLFNNKDLLLMDNNMIKSTIDVHMFDQAGIPLKYIPLVHDI